MIALTNAVIERNSQTTSSERQLLDTLGCQTAAHLSMRGLTNLLITGLLTAFFARKVLGVTPRRKTRKTISPLSWLSVFKQEYFAMPLCLCNPKFWEVPNSISGEGSCNNAIFKAVLGRSSQEAVPCRSRAGKVVALRGYIARYHEHRVASIIRDLHANSYPVTHKCGSPVSLIAVQFCTVTMSLSHIEDGQSYRICKKERKATFLDNAHLVFRKSATTVLGRTSIHTNQWKWAHTARNVAMK